MISMCNFDGQRGPPMLVKPGAVPVCEPLLQDLGEPLVAFLLRGDDTSCSRIDWRLIERKCGAASHASSWLLGFCCGELGNWGETCVLRDKVCAIAKCICCCYPQHLETLSAVCCGIKM